MSYPADSKSEFVDANNAKIETTHEVVNVNIGSENLDDEEDYSNSNSNMRPGVTFAWNNVGYEVEQRIGGKIFNTIGGTVSTKSILQNVSGYVKPGEVLAMMGPSGAGKSTLLDLLAGRLSSGTVSGEVTMNGTPLKRKLFKSQSAYVQQDDELRGSMTVRETLMFSAELSIKGSHEERCSRVNAVIDELGLVSCADTYVGDVFRKGISGGQRRRLAIGTELLTNPLLMFLDEPTSGLDSASAAEVVGHITQLAKNHNMTVILTIHQPSADVFFLAKRLLLLAQGQVAYFGLTADSVSYFDSIGYPIKQYSNPADEYIKNINPDFTRSSKVNTTEDILEKYRTSQAAVTEGEIQEIKDHKTLITSVLEKRVKPNNASILYTLTKRMLTEYVRNVGLIWVRIAMYLMLALMIGTIFWQIDSDDQIPEENIKAVSQRAGLIFFVAGFMVFMSISVLPFYIQERVVFMRERMNSYYGVLPYVLSVSISAIPGIACLALLTTAIIYPMASLNGGVTQFLQFFANLFLSLYAAEGLMLMFAALVDQYIIAMAMAAAMYGAFMLTEGFMVTVDNLPDPWIWLYYLGFHTYTFSWFMQNEFYGLTFCGEDPTSQNCFFKNGEEVIEYYHLGEFPQWLDAIVLVGWCVVFRAIYYLLLRYLQKGRK